MRILALRSGACGGAENMALDEALLEWVRQEPQPVLILRTYRWETPTLSLGVNQKVRDVNTLLRFYGQGQAAGSVVRRPTGGRAILHGEDISHAFITNEPEMLRKSLKDSYAVYAGLVRDALSRLDIHARFSEAAGTRDYLRSAICFETHTPSDLLGERGQKISGSAQLRRAGGLLQHGAAFLKPYGIEEADFFNAVREATAEALQHPVILLSPVEIQDMLPELSHFVAAYRKLSGEILVNASTTSGSHLEPASR